MFFLTVPPSWIVEPQDVHTSKQSAQQHRRLECRADGSPKPTVKWITAKGATIESEYLDIHKYRTGNVDSYECVADNGVGEPLKKTVKVSFMGMSFSGFYSFSFNFFFYFSLSL